MDYILPAMIYILLVKMVTDIVVAVACLSVALPAKYLHIKLIKHNLMFEKLNIMFSHLDIIFLSCIILTIQILTGPRGSAFLV